MSNLPGLVVDVEARIDKLEKSLARANRAQAKSAETMERRAKRSSDRMGRAYAQAGTSIERTFANLGSSLKGGLLAGASVAGISALTASVQQTVKSVAELGDQAKRAGLDVEKFQQLRFVATENRIEVDAMVDGLKELNLRADEWIVTGAGPAAEAFDRLGFSATDLKRRLEDPSELFLEITRRLEGLDRAAQIRIADEIFGGTGGEQFVQLLGRGETALRQTMQRAQNTGQVLDREVIEKAAEIDRKFAALQTRTATFFRSVVVNAADAGQSLFDFRGELVSLRGVFDDVDRAGAVLGDDVAGALDGDRDAINAHRDAIRELAGVYNALGADAAELQDRFSNAAGEMRALGYGDLAAQLDEAGTKVGELASGFEQGEISAHDFEAQLATVLGTAKTALGELGLIDRIGFRNVVSGVEELTGRLENAAARARELRASLPGSDPSGETDALTYSGRGGDPRSQGGSITDWRARTATAQAPTSSVRPQQAPNNIDAGLPPLDVGGGGGSTGGGGGAASQSDYQSEIASIAEETAALQLEAQALAEVAGARRIEGDAIEFARTRAELLHAAQQSGVAMTPAVTAKIDELARAYTAAGLEAETAASKIAEVQNASRAGANSIAGIFSGLATGATTAGQAVQQLLGQILRLSIQKRLLAMAETTTGPMGGFLQLLGGGFAGGGWTGPGSTHEPVGIVHADEYVFSKRAVGAIGVQQLDALHAAARRGYSAGGLVGGSTTRNGKTGLLRGSPGAQEININAPITVNGSAGTPEQNAQLARQIRKEMEGGMRQVVQSEIANQMRPGAMLNR